MRWRRRGAVAQSQSLSCPRAVGGTARVFRDRRSSPPPRTFSSARQAVYKNGCLYALVHPWTASSHVLAPRVKNSTHPSQYYPPSPTRAPTPGHAAAARCTPPLTNLASTASCTARKEFNSPLQSTLPPRHRKRSDQIRQPA